MAGQSINLNTYRLPRELDNSEAKARAVYLRELSIDIENRLSSSIHGARFLDLEIDDTPKAVHLPWRYVDNCDHQEFAELDEALDLQGNRLLLLGTPGAGKTTTLLHIAKRMVELARHDSTLSIPLMVNLSKLDLSPRASGISFPFISKKVDDQEAKDTRIEEWLVNEFSRYPGISHDIARKWVYEGRISALLDGLDEVDDQRRKEVVIVLNEMYLFRYPEQPIVVCSRIDEYLPLQEVKETRLQLAGAITLQPLNEEQIASYLKAACAEHLSEAINQDDALGEMARTPLTLSMMTLAYSSRESINIVSGRSLVQRRHDLMESYVAKMLQRNARRDQGLPFDENPDNDIPKTEYEYSPESVNKYLGWLALRMSTRMQTAFAPDQVY